MRFKNNYMNNISKQAARERITLTFMDVSNLQASSFEII